MILVGFSGSGKSTVGPLLADRLGVPFVDLDEEIERRAGRSIRAIFETEGELRFRDLETDATRDASLSAGVIAVGGGWMSRPELRDCWPDAIRVWLRVAPETAVRRLGKAIGTRPLLAGEEPNETARALMESRTEDYERAELEVATDDRTPEEVADAVLRGLGNISRRSD